MPAIFPFFLLDEMSFFALWKSRRVAQEAKKKFETAVENCRRKRDGEEPILGFGARMAKKLSPIFPCGKAEPANFYERLFFRGTREHFLLRLAVGVFLCETFGIMMYYILAFKYAINPGQTGTVVACVVHLILTIMFLIPQLLSYLLLSIYRMVSSKIKALLIIAIISLAFDVTAMNAMTNVHRIAEGIACVQMDVSSSASAVDENIAKHGEMGLDMMQSLVVKLAKPVNFFKRMMRRLDTTVTRVVEMVRQSWSQLSGLTNKCKRLMRGPFLVCLNKFHDAYILCLQQERNLGLDLCGSIQRANKICDMGKTVADSVCMFPAKVKNGITEGAVPYFKKSWESVKEQVNVAQYFKVGAVREYIEKGKKIRKEIKNLATLNLRIEEKHSETKNIEKLEENVKRALKRMIDTPRRIVEWTQTVIRWIFLPVALIYPFYKTAFFVYKFNYRDNYRNTYLTREFDHIDDDCALKGHSKVLPLNQDEKQLYVQRWRFKMTAAEKRKVYLNLVLSTLAVATPAFFVFLDVGLYTVVTSVFEIFQRTTIDYPAHYDIKVAGNSSGSEMLKSLLDTFSPITEGMDERKERWKKCFREPSPPAGDVIAGMFLLFVICLILCPVGVWMERQSLSLADYFYPHRVRYRALHLYNEILRRRQHLMTFMYARQRAILADDQMAGREQLVRRGMQSRGFVRVNCISCKKTQMRLSDEPNVRLCVQCGSFYCITCFSFREECLDCGENMQIIDGMELWHGQLSEDELSEEEIEDEEGEEDQPLEVTPPSTDFMTPSSETTQRPRQK